MGYLLAAITIPIIRFLHRDVLECIMLVVLHNRDNIQVYSFGESQITVVRNWQSDGDTNGILYFLGTARGSALWQNPVTAGLVNLTSTPGQLLKL